MHTKQQAIKYFYFFPEKPENLDRDEIIQTAYKQYVVKNVEKGFKDFEDGNFMSLDESRKKLLGK